MKYNGICAWCVHYKWSVDLDRPTCKAFPEQIPDEIMLSGFDHRTEYPGDGGVRFQAVDADAARKVELQLNRPKLATKP